MFANGGSGIRVPEWIRILSMLLVVYTGVIGAIEVHEDVNEGPIVSARLNVTSSSSSSSNGSGGILLTTKLPPLVNERNVNDPGSPASQHHHQQQQQQYQQSGIDESAHNFTTFPSNHRQQHAADHGNGDALTTVVATVESVAAPSSDPSSFTTSRASPEGPAGPVTTSTAITTASQPLLAHQPASSPSTVGLAAFRAASNSNSPAKAPSIVRDRARTRTAVQHQISGYRKRQLYASATQPRNANGSASAGNEPSSEQSIEAPFSRDFVPSPEVGVYYGDENSPMVPIQPPVTGSGSTRAPQAPRTVEHGGFVPHAITPAVDALYPGTSGNYGDTTAGDNRWYSGSTTPVVRGYHHHHHHQQQHLKTSAIPTTVKWEHKYPMWSQSQQPQSQTNVVKFPQEAQVTSPAAAQFPTPKGKWKWIPEEEDGDGGKEGPGAGAGVTFSSAGSTTEESSLLRQQQQQPGIVTLSRPTSVYTFERIPSSVEVPVPGGTPFSSEGVSGGGASGAGLNSSTEVTGGTSKEVLIGGKEELHQKSAAVSPWKKIIHVLTAAIPIGLLISALTPQVVYINPNATLPPQSTQLQTPSPVSGAGLSSGGLRQRSLDATGVPDPIGAIQLFQKLMALEHDAELAGGGDDVSNRLMNAAGTPTAPNRLQHCDWMLLCQLVHQRQSPESVAVRRMLWKMLANETPPEWVRQLGLDQILRSIRDGDCGQLQRTCHQHQHQEEQQDT